MSYNRQRSEKYDMSLAVDADGKENLWQFVTICESLWKFRDFMFLTQKKWMIDLFKFNIPNKGWICYLKSSLIIMIEIFFVTLNDKKRESENR